MLHNFYSCNLHVNISNLTKKSATKYIHRKNDVVFLLLCPIEQRKPNELNSIYQMLTIT
jgi:hypothetical protein